MLEPETAPRSRTAEAAITPRCTLTKTRNAPSIRQEAGSDPLAYGFAGEALDSTTNLAYHRARWMDSRVGRFTGMDRAPGRSRHPLSLNHYLYTSANPINRLDPTGRDDLVDVSVSVDIAGIHAIAEDAPLIHAPEVIAEVESEAQLGEVVSEAEADFAEVEEEVEAEAEAETECTGGSCEGSTCFAPETPVATETGERFIRDVQVGDRVWSADPSTGTLALETVLRRFVTPHETLLDVEFIYSNGSEEIVRATPTHRLWVVARGWVTMGELHPFDVVLLRNGGTAVVGGEQLETDFTTVYNIEVEHDHTYFVGNGGVYVHNGCKDGTPGNNQAQNKQFKAAIREAERQLGRKLSKGEIPAGA